MQLDLKVHKVLQALQELPVPQVHLARPGLRGHKAQPANRVYRAPRALLAPLDQQVRRDQLAPQVLRVRKGLQELQASPVRLVHRVPQVNKAFKDHLG